jgi:hypothetical protein
MWGLAAGVASGAVGSRAPQLAGLLQLPTVALLHAMIAVADVASRVPVSVDGRALWAVVALGALAVAARRARNLRRDGRDEVAVPAR